ncbi:MAG: tetratricopeptide repeat protein, partial [Aggregatilineales bacterium]
MTQLPVFTPTLDDRLTAEFLDQSLALLTPPMVVPPTQDMAPLNALAWRFERPEPPRDPDLPLLPAKAYPHLAPALVEATIRALQPPPPVTGLVGRRVELDQAVGALFNDRAALLTGGSGIGKTALLRQIGIDPRVRQRFRQVWWFDSLDAVGDAIGLALELPHVLRADPADQPKLAREFLVAANVLLLFDNLIDAEQIAYALQFGTGVALSADLILPESSTPEAGFVEVSLPGLDGEAASGLIGTSDADSLIERVGGNPRALKLLNALLAEDGLTPDDAMTVMGSDESNSEFQPVAALFAASFAALPTEYQRVYQALPISGPVALSEVVARFPSALAARRALAFLERRGFIERIGETIHAVYTPIIDAPVDQDSPTDRLPTIDFPARAFRGVSATPIDAADPRSRARELYQDGVKALEERRDSDAETSLIEALTLRQSHDHAHAVAETRVALARLAYLRGDDTTAIQQLETAAEAVHQLRDSESLDVVRIALSRVYRRAGRLDAALSVLGDDAPPADWFALYAAREDWNAALEVARRNPNVQAARSQTAYALLCLGRPADALQRVADADDYDARLMRAYSYHMQGDCEKALAAYDRADTMAARDSDRGALARAQARALATLGRIREAAIRVGAEGVWYESHLPRPAFARQQASHALYAALSLTQGDADSAESAARRALQPDGERPDPTAHAIAHHVLARIAAARADREAALRAYQAALNEREASPRRDEAAIGLTLHAIADQYAAQGDFERAIPNYRLALTHFDAPDERRTRLITLLALRETLAGAGRQSKMLEAGQQALDLALESPEADLPTLGYVLNTHIRALHESGRAARAAQVLTEWLNRLARRAGDAFDSPAWGIQVLGIGLVVRSALAGGAGTDHFSPALLHDLAEEAVSVAELYMPGTPIAWAARRDLGEILLAQEHIADAAETFAPLVSAAEESRVAAESPFIALRVRIGAARAALALGNATEAVRHFDAALPLEPDSLPRGRLIRESAAARAAAGDLTDAAARYVESLTILDRDRALNEHVGALVDLGYVRLRLGQFGPAIETFETALSIVQELPDRSLMASVLVDLANAHHTLGQYRRAAATYRRALAYQPPSARPPTLLALARTNVALSDHSQALIDFQDTLQINPPPDIYRAAQIEIASVYVALKRPRQAIEAYQTALTFDELDTVEVAAIQRSLGQQYTILGQHDQARVYFEKALQAIEDDQTGLTLRAIADGYRAQGQASAALDAYHRALPQLDRARYPVEYAAVKRAIGELTLDAGQPDEAVP